MKILYRFSYRFFYFDHVHILIFHMPHAHIDFPAAHIFIRLSFFLDSDYNTAQTKYNSVYICLMCIDELHFRNKKRFNIQQKEMRK